MKTTLMLRTAFGIIPVPIVQAEKDGDFFFSTNGINRVTAEQLISLSKNTPIEIFTDEPETLLNELYNRSPTPIYALSDLPELIKGQR